MELSSADADRLPLKRRRAWLAALLSLLAPAPVGQVYVGRLRRGIMLWCIGLGVFCVVLVVAATARLGRAGLAILLLCALAPQIAFAVDAFLIARRQPYLVLKRYQRWWCYLLFYVLFVAGNNGAAHFCRTFIAEGFAVPSRSMSPTIMAGETLLADKLFGGSASIRRGDVVIFRRSEETPVNYVHRVIGMPGDELEIRNERVYINGAAWDDPHAVFEGPLPPAAEMINYGPEKVPPDSFFIMGDNRRRAKDSRLTGPIAAGDVIAVARFIYWSRERTFPNPDDIEHYTLGAVRWGRIGARLD